MSNVTVEQKVRDLAKVSTLAHMRNVKIKCVTKSSYSNRKFLINIPIEDALKIKALLERKQDDTYSSLVEEIAQANETGEMYFSLNASFEMTKYALPVASGFYEVQQLLIQHWKTSNGVGVSFKCIGTLKDLSSAKIRAQLSNGEAL